MTIRLAVGACSALLLACGLLASGLPARADEALNNCNATGSGVLATGETLAMSIHSVGGGVRGVAHFTTAAGSLDGSVLGIACRRDGGGGPGVPGDFAPNIAEIEGIGAWNGAAGYEFACTAHDHGEGKSSDPLPDEFACVVALEGEPIATTSGLVAAGNFQLRPPQG
jgi:hypothetical protein